MAYDYESKSDENGITEYSLRLTEQDFQLLQSVAQSFLTPEPLISDESFRRTSELLVF